ncbi:hypothetical protein E3N88_20500 [Mikania micrantha]|uniref:Aminotransferase-like plant mobile domain-containing protein n=1 Tax=Mikania micrantha TaxID=192012 RepID=A0A5N6NJN0_9ASTR|nr:hypothetical protein E3N88_20500 [Mikania micrantha]
METLNDYDYEIIYHEGKTNVVADALSRKEIEKPRRGDEKLWGYLRQNPITENVLQYIRLAGFSGVIECEYRRLDSALISALVERWPPETHTFHIPFGEVTVTLQDVTVLLGLRIDGNVVSGTEYHWDTEQIIANFYSLTGIILNESAVNGQRINMPFNLNTIKEMGYPENPTDLQCIQRARTIILLLIGGTLFPESSSNWVNAKYLNHIHDLSDCGELSWGIAVLSVLYRNLCRSTNISTNEVGGATLLLQLWAWERIPSIAPRCFQQIDWNKSYGARWVGPLTFRNTASHVVSTFRSELNSLSEFQFIVEPHQPGKVLRQIGMFQPIPINTLLTVDDHKKLHNSKRVSLKTCNLVDKHGTYILSWINRHNHVVNEINSNSSVASRDYMMWYWPCTVLYTSNPTHIGQNPRVFPNDGGRFQMLVYQRSNEDPVRDMAGRYMEYANATHHMSYQPTYESQSIGSQVPPMTQRVRRRGCGANVGQVNPTDQMEYRPTMPPHTTHVGESSQFIIPNVDLFGSPFGFDNMQMGGYSSQFDPTPQDEDEELVEESEDDEMGTQDLGASYSMTIAHRKQPRKNAGIGRGCGTH